MSTTSISRRYARALFEMIGDGVDVRKDLEAIAAVVAVDDVAALISSPEYPASVKAGVVAKAAGSLSAEAGRLVSMLAERGKLELAGEIAAMVEQMVRDSESEVEADVTVASAIDADQQEKISQALATSIGKKVRITVSEDQSILGGMVVRIGDRKIDYSLRTKLAGMRRALAS